MPLAAFPKCYLDAILRDRTMTMFDWLDIGASLPLDGVELYWPALRDWSDEQLTRLRRHSEELGIQLPLMCASPDFTDPDPIRYEAEIADEARAIRATALLGGHVTRVLSGQRRAGVTRQQGIDMVVAAIERLAPQARSVGVTLAIENHFKDYFWTETEFAQDSRTFRDIVDAVPDREAFGVQFDASNTYVIGEDPYALLDAVRDRVVSAAASDRESRADPTAPFGRRITHNVVGQGSLDYDRIFRALSEVGFAGWVSIEDGEDPSVGESDLRASAEYTRAAMERQGLE